MGQFFDEARKNFLKEAGAQIVQEIPGSQLFILCIPPDASAKAAIFYSSLSREDTLELLRDFVVKQAQ
jgi:hypothetical protein